MGADMPCSNQSPSVNTSAGSCTIMTSPPSASSFLLGNVLLIVGRTAYRGGLVRYCVTFKTKDENTNCTCICESMNASDRILVENVVLLAATPCTTKSIVALRDVRSRTAFNPLSPIYGADTLTSSPHTMGEVILTDGALGVAGRMNV
jgi:hypothetical protein